MNLHDKNLRWNRKAVQCGREPWLWISLGGMLRQPPTAQSHAHHPGNGCSWHLQHSRGDSPLWLTEHANHGHDSRPHNRKAFACLPSFLCCQQLTEVLQPPGFRSLKRTPGEMILHRLESHCLSPSGSSVSRDLGHLHGSIKTLFRGSEFKNRGARSKSYIFGFFVCLFLLHGFFNSTNKGLTISPVSYLERRSRICVDI